MRDESAFPTQMWDEELKEATWLDGGLTKREWFAGLAMQAEIQHLGTAYPESETRSERVANNAVAYADALLAELNKREGGG